MNGQAEQIKKDLRFTQADLQKHIELCSAFMDESRRAADETKEMITKVLDIVECNTKDIKKVKDETEDIVQFHKDIQGASRLGVKVQKFFTWVLKWPLVGGGVYALYEWVKTHLIG